MKEYSFTPKEIVYFVELLEQDAKEFGGGTSVKYAKALAEFEKNHEMKLVIKVPLEKEELKILYNLILEYGDIYGEDNDLAVFLAMQYITY